MLLSLILYLKTRNRRAWIKCKWQLRRERKLQNIHKNYNMKRHQLINERLKTLNYTVPFLLLWYGSMWSDPNKLTDWKKTQTDGQSQTQAPYPSIQLQYCCTVVNRTHNRQKMWTDVISTDVNKIIGLFLWQAVCERPIQLYRQRHLWAYRTRIRT